MSDLTRLIVTKHLAYCPVLEWVFHRKSACLEGEDLGMSKIGDIWHGPDSPIPDEVQSEWIDLIEWEAISQARR